MNKYIKNSAFAVVCIAAVGILWNQSHAHDSSISTERLNDNETVIQEITFPETYQKKINETFSIDAAVIVPEEFDSSQLYCAKAKIQEFDKEKWKDRFLKGKMENLSYREDPLYGTTREEEGEPMEFYETEDDEGLYISSQEATYVSNKFYDINKCLEFDYYHDYYYNTGSIFSQTGDLDTLSKPKAWDELMKEVKELGIRSEEFEIEYSCALDHQTLQTAEQKMLENGDLETSELKGNWSSDDDAYYYCLLQKAQGLPVYYSQKAGGCLWDIWSGAVMAYYGPYGMIRLDMRYLFEMEKGTEKIQLAPFEKIMDTLVKKYEKVITDEKQIITEIRLFLYPLHTGGNNYDVIPVWLCKLAYEGSNHTSIYIPIHAATGEEVLEME